VDGSGVKIGVLAFGVDSVGMLQASGDLPLVIVLPGQEGKGDDGTAMLEVLHDLAPGAELYFAGAYFKTIPGIAQNIIDLRAAGRAIIVDGIQNIAESLFQIGQAATVKSTTNGGLITEAARQVTESGALYFSCRQILSRERRALGYLGGRLRGCWPGWISDPRKPSMKLEDSRAGVVRCQTDLAIAHLTPCSPAAQLLCLLRRPRRMHQLDHPPTETRWIRGVTLRRRVPFSQP
jgi:hypothetical protein